MYEVFLRELLEPLGIYDLSEESVSGAEIFALGAGLDTVSQQLERTEREALTATAQEEGLTRREALFARVLLLIPPRNDARPLRPCCRLMQTASLRRPSISRFPAAASGPGPGGGHWTPAGDLSGRRRRAAGVLRRFGILYWISCRAIWRWSSTSGI